MPEQRAKAWRAGEPPIERELRAIKEWTCSVDGGVAVMLMDHTRPWPYKVDGWP